MRNSYPQPGMFRENQEGIYQLGISPQEGKGEVKGGPAASKQSWPTRFQVSDSRGKCWLSHFVPTLFLKCRGTMDQRGITCQSILTSAEAQHRGTPGAKATAQGGAGQAP